MQNFGFIAKSEAERDTPAKLMGAFPKVALVHIIQYPGYRMSYSGSVYTYLILRLKLHTYPLGQSV